MREIKPLTDSLIPSIHRSLTIDGLAPDPLPPDYSIHGDALVAPHLTQSHMRVHLYTFVCHCVVCMSFVCHLNAFMHCMYTLPEWNLAQVCVHLPWSRPCRWCCDLNRPLIANWLRNCDVFRWARRVRFAIWCTPAEVAVVWCPVLCRCPITSGSWCECWGLWQSLRTAPWWLRCSTSAVSRAS